MIKAQPQSIPFIAIIPLSPSCPTSPSIYINYHPPKVSTFPSADHFLHSPPPCHFRPLNCKNLPSPPPKPRPHHPPLLLLHQHPSRGVDKLNSSKLALIEFSLKVISSYSSSLAQLYFKDLVECLLEFDLICELNI